jgi:hypothetical protein
MSDCDKCGAHWMQSCDCVHEVFSQEAGLICSKTIEIQKLQAQLDEANKVIEFYGNEKSYDCEHDGVSVYRACLYSDVEYIEKYVECGGKNARKYLEKYNVINSTQSE